MSAAEFRITTDLAPLRQFQIEANFDETKAWLTENLEPLRTMAVTPDSMAQAKQYRASVRKVRDRIDESRKMAKAAALEAYGGFEAKCRELTALCEEAAAALDVQIKSMEDAAKQAKRKGLESYFSAVVDDMAEWITFDDAFNPRWLNATYGEAKAQSDICASIDRCRSDLNAIRSLRSPFETELLEEYRRTRDIGAALRKDETLTRLKAAEDERRRREAEAAAKYAAAIEETKRLADEAMRQAEQKASKIGKSVTETLYEMSRPVNDMVDEDSHEMPVAAQEPEYKVDFRVFGTARQLDGLKTYMQSSGIRFMPVPQE